MSNNMPSSSTHLDLQSFLSSLPRVILNTNINLSPARILAKPAFIFVLAFLLTELVRYILSTFFLLVLRSRASKSAFKTFTIFTYISLLTAAIITATINTVRSFRQYLSNDSILTTYPIIFRTLNLFLKDVRATYTIIYAIILILFCLSIPLVYILDKPRKIMSLVGKVYVFLTTIALASIRIAVYAKAEDLPVYIPEHISLHMARTFLFASILLSLLSVLMSVILGGFQKTYLYRLIAIFLQLSAITFIVAVAADSIIGGVETARRLERMFLNQSFDINTSIIPTTVRMDFSKQVTEVLESVLAQVIITTITDLFFCLVVVATAATLARFYLTHTKDRKSFQTSRRRPAKSESDPLLGS